MCSDVPPKDALHSRLKPLDQTSDRYALLVVDLEKAFTPPHHINTNKRISVVADECRSLGVPVMWVTYNQLYDDDDEIAEYSLRRIYIAKTNPDKDIYFHKPDTSALKKTNFKKVVPSGTNHLIVCGYSAYECVHATIKDALARGYKVTLLGDCTDYHRMNHERHRLYFRRPPFDREHFGKDVWGGLRAKYPKDFFIRTHLEALHDLSATQQKASRLLWLRRQLFTTTKIAKWAVYSV